MSGSDRISRSIACWHEAGHAIAAAVCNGIVRRIEVDNTGGGITHVVLPPELFDRLTIIYGGDAGRAYGTFTGGGSTTQDARRINELTAHLPAARRSSILAAAERRAVEIVTQHLPAVAHLAHALTCVGNLDQDQVDEILAQHGL